MSEKKYIKFLDYSSFEYDTFTLPKKNYPFFNIDDSNVDKVHIILIDENDNRYNSYIRYTDKSRENSPTRLLKWNKDFTSYLKKKIPNWIEIKKGETSENFKLIFEPTEDKSIFKIFVRSSEIDLSGEISNKRKNNYKKPSKTERKGMTTSRVGQGWYRTEVLKKWDWKCSVTGCEIQKILISSHIVPWRDSNDEERLDVDNGLLLSPDLDGLFDKNLISFNDDGSMIVSDKINIIELSELGININMKLRFVNDGMKKYLKRHREKLLQ